MLEKEVLLRRTASESTGISSACLRNVTIGTTEDGAATYWSTVALFPGIHDSITTQAIS